MRWEAYHENSLRLFSGIVAKVGQLRVVWVTSICCNFSGGWDKKRCVNPQRFSIPSACVGVGVSVCGCEHAHPRSMPSFALGPHSDSCLLWIYLFSKLSETSLTLLCVNLVLFNEKQSFPPLNSWRLIWFSLRAFFFFFVLALTWVNIVHSSPNRTGS